jgi:hypothetical protein
MILLRNSSLYFTLRPEFPVFPPAMYIATICLWLIISEFERVACAIIGLAVLKWGQEK